MLLMFIYDFVGNYGVSLIFFAIIVRGVLLPFQMKSKPGMMRQSRLQPKIAEIQKKYASNKAKMNEEVAKLYKEEGVNPASGCLWGFLPLPIMLALFLVIRQPLTMMLGLPEALLEEGGALFEKFQWFREIGIDLKSTVSPAYLQIDQAQWISQYFNHFKGLNIEGLRMLNFDFLGLNLGIQPQWDFLWTANWSVVSEWLPGLALFMIPLISGGSQFAASAINRKLNPPISQDGQGKSMQVMMMFMPLLSIYFAFITPAALGFYWTIGTVIQVLQDVWLTKRYTRILDAEEAVKNEARKKKEAELEAKRLETERKKAEGLLVDRNPNTSKRKQNKTTKQEQLEKAAEWEKKNAPSDEPEKYEPSRVDNRRYARGRAYDPDRFTREAEDNDYNDDDDEALNPEARDSGSSDDFEDEDYDYDEDEDEVDN